MSEKCPTCGSRRGAISHGSNSCPTTAIHVPDHLLPALQHALMIGSTTAIMCGAPEAGESLEKIKQQVDTPNVAELFERYEYFSLCERAQKGQPLKVELLNDGRYRSTCHWIKVTDESGMAWPGSNRDNTLESTKFSSEQDAQDSLQNLRDVLTQISPMGV